MLHSTTLAINKKVSHQIYTYVGACCHPFLSTSPKSISQNHLAWAATAGRHANSFDVIKRELEKAVEFTQNIFWAAAAAYLV